MGGSFTTAADGDVSCLDGRPPGTLGGGVPFTPLSGRLPPMASAELESPVPAAAT